MASELVHSDGLTPVADNAIVVQSSNASASSFTHSSPTANKEIRGKKMPDNTHGLRFESKLLALFCVRGLGAGYKFELSKEKEDEGGKLEDLIFRYEVPDTTPAGKHWRYRYLQAKHKENEGEKITADQLLGCKRKGDSSDSFPKNHLRDYNPKGDFNLTKYFHAFYKIRARGDDIHDCIICTNIGFDVNSLKEVGIELVSINNQSEDILKFDAPEKTAHYKLKINNNDWHKQLKEEWSPVQLLAEELKNCATNNKTTQIRTGMLNSYHAALVDEHVIDCTTKKFHQDFVGEVNLSEGARELRQTICELEINDSWKDWKFKLSNNFGKGQSSAVKNPLPGKITEKDVKEFFDKLVFVVDMPSEEKFEKIIETKDVSKYYPKDKCEDQTTQIFDGISKAFIGQPANFWLTSEVAKNILLKNVSKQYKEQLDKKVGFNKDAIKVMEEKLGLLIDSSGKKKIQWIATPSPQLTAVKVIAAIENLLEMKLKQKEICQGNCLITPSSLSQDEEEKWRNILKLKNYSYDFFVVVCDNEASIQNHENVFPEGKAEDKNFLIIICRDESSAGIKDEMQFTDLSDNFQKRILSKTISFQGKNVEVRDLVGDKPEELINFSSTNELLLAENEVKIPSFNASNFEQSLYVKRTLTFPFQNQFELGGECRISSDGHIEWLVKKEKRKELWEKIMNGITNQASSTGKPVEDIDLMNLKEKGNEKPIFIISGVAGTGKSTLLCHYYEEIKKAKPDHWVIRINLVDYEAGLKLDQNMDFDVIDLIINRLYVVDHKSSFSRSLLRKRLETGDQIVVMFDGFDEINEQCQKGAIEWMKAITKDRLIQLYVTTRPHMVKDLQFQLSQLAYSLENFTEEDQIKNLTSCWVKELNLSRDNEKPLQQFAKLLVERVSETLKDEEKSFIGIPLQCRILAECFQSNVKELITLNYAEDDEDSLQSVSEKISSLLDGEKFDLVKLYNLLMETKRQVFREEKAKTPSSVENKIVTDAINHLIKDVESHLTKLAIKTIVEDKKIVDVLWPPTLSHQSNKDVAAEEKIIAMNGLSFGLTIESVENKTNATQFLHRTYAEYLFARYLYEGFLLDDDQHNKLLENESIQKLILNKILSIEQYDGVQVFFNGMLKNLVDDDQEWRNRIIQRDLPERFTKFAEHLFTQILRKYPSSRFPFQRVTEERSWIFPNALCYSISTGKEKIFKILCDFLDATFDKKLIQNAMMNSFMPNKSYFSFKFFRNTESELFERFLSYFYSAPFVLKRQWAIPPCDLEYSQWNGKEQQNMVRRLLEFFIQRTTFDTQFSNNILTLTFLIFNENYDSHLEIYLERLSRSANYSDDSKFEHLLKMVLRQSKKPFVRGRIGKMLIILNELKRHNLLTRLYGTILVTEPEAFHSIYNPTEEEGVITADLHFLLERDSYCMTRLHRAAFHGNTKAIEEMLGRIGQNLADPEQKEVADQVVTEVLARDEYGFTPFYVAAACGHKEIYQKMLAFLKQVLPDVTLEEHLIDEGGFVHRALSDAIQSENIQMFQLILEAVKKVLGQKELIRVLNPELHFHSRERNSFMRFTPIFFFFDRCKTEELFSAMVKIVVTRDDNVADYTDLYDLLSQKYWAGKQHTLKFVDAESLQGLLSLKGVEDFTKCILDIEGLSIGFELISRYFLKHFTKDQLEQFVQTMTSKNYTQKDGGSRREFTVDSARAHNKKEIEDEIRQRYFSGWPIELGFQDLGNGTTAIYAHRLKPRPSYWRDYIEDIFSYSNSTYLELYRDSDGFPFRGRVDSICECFKCVGDISAKKLLLHEETQCYIMMKFPQNERKLLLNCLTQESQEEVKQKWKNNAPLFSKLFPSTSQTFSEIYFPARISSAILHFYLEYGSEDHLKEFAKVVTVLHNNGKVQHSLWSYVFENVDSRETHDILKLVSEKTEFLGRDNVKWLLIHEIDNVPFIIKAVSWGEDVDLWLAILPEDLREEIQQFIQQKAPDLIEIAFRYPPAYFKTFSWGHYHKRLNTLTFFLNYSNEHQLQSFVKNITSKRVGGQQGVHERSMWGEITLEWKSTDEYGKKKTEDFEKTNKFMKIVSEKLGPNAVKELLLHQDGELLVVFYLALRGEEKMLEMLLNYLPDKDQKEVQSKVDKFLDETYKIPQDDQDWSKYLNDIF